MDLAFNTSLLAGYKSASQMARRLTEDWMAREGFCLACDADELTPTRANTPANDFVCPRCAHRYELKSFRTRPRKINDGAYRTMLEKIEAGSASSFLLLQYTPEWQANTLSAIHSSFLLPRAIEQRNPLSPEAERAGWVGCNILLDKIPSDGEIAVLRQGDAVPVPLVRQRFQRFLPLAKKSSESRGWTLLTLTLLRSLGLKDFELADAYRLQPEFAAVYPENRHIRDKIRQQLQVLRDMGVVEFLGQGSYRFLD